MTDTDAAPAMRDTLTITLRKPVEFAGDTYERLELREPTVIRLMQWSDLTGVERDIKAVSATAAVPPAVIGQILARDLIAAARFVSSFSVVAAPDDAEPAPSLTIDLIEPIKAGEASFKAVTLREPTAAELIEWEKADGVAGDCKIVAAVSGIPEKAIQQMRVSQFTEAAAYLSRFFVGSPPAGAPS